MLRKKPNFVVDFNLYHDALKTCIHDDDWLERAFSDKVNMLEFAKPLIKNQPNKVINEFFYTKDISTIIKNKKNQVLENNQLLYLLNPDSEDAKIKLINDIKNKTSYYGQAVVGLLSEYCENTRDFFDATVIPHPSKMSETIRPIKKFGVVITEDKSIIMELTDKGAIIHNEGSQFSNLKNYLQNRANSKELISGFISQNYLSKDHFNNIATKLNFYKETEIPTFRISNVPSDYKVVLRKNKTFQLEENIMSLTGNNLHILAISRMNHEQK